MEDVKSLPDLTQAISAFSYDLGALAGQLGEFIAQLHVQTYRNDWFAEKFANLPVQKTRLQVQYNGCREFCKNAGRSDADDIGRFCRKLGEKFNSVGKCLIMGDLWPASILVAPGEIRLIDWEFVHFGRPAQDVAHLYSHLWMTAHRYKDQLKTAGIRKFHAYPDVAHPYINLTVHVQDSPMYPCTGACKSVALPWPRFSVHYRKPLMARIAD